MRELIWVSVAAAGEVLGIDVATGDVARRARGFERPAALCASRGRVCVVDTGRGAVAAVDGDGRELWVSRLCAGPTHIVPSRAGDALFVLASEGEAVAKIDAATGDPLTLLRLPGWPTLLKPALGREALIAVSCQPDALHTLSSGALELEGTCALERCAVDVCAHGDDVFVLEDGLASIARFSRGKPAGRVSLGFFASRCETARDGRSLIVTRPGGLTCYRLPDLTPWRSWDTGGSPEDIVCMPDGRAAVLDRACQCVRILCARIGPMMTVPLRGEPTGIAFG